MELDEGWVRNFGEQLDKVYAWPTLYTFKFIVKSGQEAEVQKLFPRHTNSTKSSKNGKYTSLTFQMMMPSSEAVISVYKLAASIEGIIAL